MVLLKCNWGFPVSWILYTLDFVALTEEKRLRPNPATIIAEIRTETPYVPSLIDEMSPDSTICHREHFFDTDDDRDCRLLQLLVVVNASLQS